MRPVGSVGGVNRFLPCPQAPRKRCPRRRLIRIDIDDGGQRVYKRAPVGVRLYRRPGRNPISLQFRQRIRSLADRAYGTLMANTSSAKKAARKIARRTTVNKMRRSRMRTAIRKVEDALTAGDKVAASAAFKSFEPEIMRAVSKGILHRNTASRKVSRLAQRLKKIGSS